MGKEGRIRRRHMWGYHRSRLALGSDKHRPTPKRVTVTYYPLGYVPLPMTVPQRGPTPNLIKQLHQPYAHG